MTHVVFVPSYLFDDKKPSRNDTQGLGLKCHWLLVRCTVHVKRQVMVHLGTKQSD